MDFRHPCCWIIHVYIVFCKFDTECFEFLLLVKLIYQSKGSTSLFEGTYYNTRMSELCVVYSRAQTKQGYKVIKEYGTTGNVLCMYK